MLGIALALIAAAGWGAGAVLTRVGISGVRISVGVLVSLAASLAVIATAAAALDWQGLGILTPANAGWFAMTGLVGYPLGRQLNFRSISYIGAARSTPIMSSSPLFAILFAVLFTGEVVTLTQVGGALMIVAGLAVVMSSDSGGRNNGKTAMALAKPGVTRDQWLGYGFAIAAGVAYGLNNVLIKQGLKTYEHPLWAASIALTSGTLVLLLLSLPYLRNIAAERQRGLVMLVGAGMASAIGVACSYSALNLAPVSVVSPITATFPLWTLLGVRLFLARDELVTIRMVLGAVLVVVGVGIVAVTKA